MEDKNEIQKAVKELKELIEECQDAHVKILQLIMDLKTKATKIEDRIIQTNSNRDAERQNDIDKIRPTDAEASSTTTALRSVGASTECAPSTSGINPQEYCETHISEDPDEEAMVLEEFPRTNDKPPEIPSIDTLQNADNISLHSNTTTELTFYIHAKHKLFQAARSGNLEILRRLLADKINPEFKDNNKKTALHYATEGSHLNCIKELLKYLKSPNARDCESQTALHRACFNGNKDCVDEILKHPKLKPNCKDNNKQTPLHLAAQKDISCVKSLLGVNGIRKNEIDTNGKTPFDLAKDSDIRSLLKPRVINQPREIKQPTVVSGLMNSS